MGLKQIRQVVVGEKEETRRTKERRDKGVGAGGEEDASIVLSYER